MSGKRLDLQRGVLGRVRQIPDSARDIAQLLGHVHACRLLYVYRHRTGSARNELLGGDHLVGGRECGCVCWVVHSVRDCGAAEPGDGNCNLLRGKEEVYSRKIQQVQRLGPQRLTVI